MIQNDEDDEVMQGEVYTQPQCYLTKNTLRTAHHDNERHIQISIQDSSIQDAAQEADDVCENQIISPLSANSGTLKGDKLTVAADPEAVKRTQSARNVFEMNEQNNSFLQEHSKQSRKSTKQPSSVAYIDLNTGSVRNSFNQSNQSKMS